MIEQRVTLRYDAQQIPAIVQAVQGDTGRDVIFELADYEIPAGATANYYIDKPDDTAIYNSAEVISSTEILAHLTEQALAVPGRNNGQVRILSDGEVITSFDFVLEVEVFRGILHMQSETKVNIFDAAIQETVDDAIEEIQAQTPVVTGMQNSIAPTYSSSSTYAVDDYVMYNAQLYRCKTDITTGEAWTAAHWTQVPLANDVKDLKSAINKVGVPTTVPQNYADETYANVLTSVSVVSDAKIKAGERLTNVNVFSNASFGSGCVYLVDDNNKCVKRWEVTGASGWNNIAINYTTDVDVRIGFYGIPIKYINDASIGDEYVFSANGLNSASPLSPTVGDTVTINKLYSWKWALSLNWTIASKYIKQICENTSDIDLLSKAISSEYVQPEIYDDLTKYANALSGLSSLSDKEIPGSSLILSVEVYSIGSQNGHIFIIRKSDNVCVYKKDVELSSGWNTIEINYFTDAPCYIGQYSTGVKYTNAAVDAGHAFSTKIHSTSPYLPTVGETVTISDNYSGNYALSMKWNIKSGLPALSGAIVEINESKESQKIYDHTCIVSIIDDDTGKYVPSIWGDILAQTSIRMGFACVTGFMAGLETPPEIYEQMSLEDLRNLYNAGHEVYSHSYSHPAFYSPNTTLAEIERQCRLSKQWLESNGFSRNANTIVYPGGLGEAQTEKQDVVRQFYHFGVDTVGGGINPEPLQNDLCIYRINADTATLAELQAKVDNAITERKLLVFMNHAYELNRDRTAQVQKMIDIINYIKNQGGLIIPLTEALHRIYGW